MKKEKCPACGEIYDGKLCKRCGYSTFHEEKRLPWWAVFAGVVLVLGVLIWAVSPYVMEALAPKPDPLAAELYKGGTVLFAGGGVMVTADWQDGQSFGEGIPITLHNDTEEKISIAFKEIVANGYVMETSLFQLSAEPGETAEAVFTLHETDLRNTGMAAVTEVSFNLTAYGTLSFTSIAKTDRITLKGAIPPGFVQNVESDGTVLYDEEGVKIVLRSYEADPNALDDVTKAKFLFYIQNNTERHLRISMPEVQVNGQALDIGIWSELLPGTKVVTGMYLYRLKDLGIQSPFEVETLGYNIEITDRDDAEYHVMTELATVKMWES